MDALDRRIVDHLLRDGRATFQEIGKVVGLSAPATKRRVDRMRERGEIAGFTALIDPAALGWDTAAYVELSYQGNVSAERLKRDLEAFPEVIGAWTITGDADALVHIVASSMADLERVIEGIRAVEQVDRSRTVVVMSRLFERPLHDGGRQPRE